MKKRDLHIAEPCHASWEAMTGDDARRFCDSCQKHVHHLSGMTRREAERLLSAPREGGSLCVRYAHDTAGEVRFRALRRRATAPMAQRRGAAELVATASAFAAMLGACAWPAAFAQEEMMGEPAVLEYGEGVVQGAEAVPMGQVPSQVEPCDGERGGAEPSDGSGDGAWGPMDPLPVQGGMMDPEPWDETLNDLEDADDQPPDIDDLQPTMGRLPVVPSEAIYEQEKQAAAALGELGLTLEEEELVDDPDGEPDARVIVDRPLPESPWIAAQGGMMAPVELRR